MTYRTTKDIIDHVGIIDIIAETLAWTHGVVLRGINFDYYPTHCRVILKGFREGRAIICFINTSDAERCLEVLDEFLHKGASTGVDWKIDQYYKPPQNAT